MIKVTEREIFDILSGKISRAINRTVLKAFSQEGIDITTEQWTVLSCLWNKDKIIQQEICDLTQKDKPSIGLVRPAQQPHPSHIQGYIFKTKNN